MQYRVSAMYNHSRKIIILIIGCFLSEAIPMIVMFGLAHKSEICMCVSHCFSTA